MKNMDIPSVKKIENLISLVKKAEKNPWEVSYAIGNWWYENCPDYITTTGQIVMSFIRDNKDISLLNKVFKAQKDVKIDGIPTIKEDMRALNSRIYSYVARVR